MCQEQVNTINEGNYELSQNVEKVQITENVDHIGCIIGGYTLKVSTVFRGTQKRCLLKRQTTLGRETGVKTCL